MERRRIDEELAWPLMRFPDEPEEPPSRRAFGTRIGPTAPQQGFGDRRD
jgi:hypothetical protein